MNETQDRATVSPRRRAITWGLHVLVSMLAVLSLFSWRFDLWIDLRFAGGIVETVLPVVWAISVLLVPMLTGPVLRGFRCPEWVQSFGGARFARILLWPTYLMMICLVANSVWYYRLIDEDLVDTNWAFPITAYVFLVLGAWVFCTLTWQARSHSEPATRRQQAWAGVWAVGCALGIAGFILVHSFRDPPKQPVDLAVVLGHRVLLDGTASVTLRERTLVAARLHHAGKARHIMVSGMMHDPYNNQKLSEALAMYQVLREDGVPREAITIDPVGVNSRATVAHAVRLMRERGWTSVVACSSDYHLPRLSMAFAGAGQPASVLASERKVWRCADVRDAVREMAGLVTYALVPSYRPAKVEVMSLKEPRVVVHKKAGKLELFDGEKLVKTYACITGRNSGDKEMEGDRRTPLGTFRIVFKNPTSKFHLSLGLDYPDKDDAERGLKAGLITREQYDGIMEALRSDLSLEENQKKLWYTPLGGEIFIHGHAEGRSGTAGCIAVTNPEIEELYAILPTGTPVEIRE